MPQNNDPLGILGSSTPEQATDPLGILSQTPPQKKNSVGSPSQGGLQGSQDGITVPSGGIEVPPAALPGLGGVERLKEGEWAPTVLKPEEEQQFRNFMTNDPNVVAWAEEFKNNYGEVPDLEAGGYDYRGAWKAGMIPRPYTTPEGNTEYHWGSIGEMGKDLKSPDHPTRWKSDYMQTFGKDPDQEGVSEPVGKFMVGLKSGMKRVMSKVDNEAKEIASGEIIINGSPVSNNTAKKNAYDREFIKGLLEGRNSIEFNNADPYIESIYRSQIEAGGEYDEWKSLKAGLLTAEAGLRNMPVWMNDVLEEATGIDNILFTTVGSISPEARKMAASGEMRNRLKLSAEKVLKAAEAERESKFKIDDPSKGSEAQRDVIDLFNQGKYGEVGRYMLNTTIESGPVMLTSAGAALATGNPIAGAAFLVPMSASMNYAETGMDDSAYRKLAEEKGITDRDAAENFIQSTRIAKANVSGLAEGIPEALMGKVITNSFKVFSGGVKQVVGEMAEKAGPEAAKRVAEETAKTTATEIVKNFAGATALGGLEEFTTTITNELTDVFLGTSNKTFPKIMRTAFNDGIVGMGSTGIIVGPGAGTALSAKGLQATKKLFDNAVTIDPSFMQDISEHIETQVEAGRMSKSQAAAIEENLSKREKAVKAVPEDKVSDTETVDTVQEIQELEERKKGLLPVYQEPIQAEIDAKTEKLKEGIGKDKPRLDKEWGTNEGNEALSDAARRDFLYVIPMEEVDGKMQLKEKTSPKIVAEQSDRMRVSATMDSIIERGIKNGLSAEDIIGELADRGFRVGGARSNMRPKEYVQARIDGKEVPTLREIFGYDRLTDTGVVYETDTERRETPVNPAPSEVAPTETVEQAEEVAPADEITVKSGPIQKQPLKPIPTGRDQFTSKLSDFSDVIYRETDSDGLLTLADPMRFGDVSGDYYFSNDPDLALGQGKNKGFIIEADASKLKGSLNTSKPGYEQIYSSGSAELIARYNDKKDFLDSILSITVKPDSAPKNMAEKMKFNSMVSGWEKIENADGSVTYRKPTPTTDAVQEQSTESVPVRQQPEARQGVREEDTQGQETPQEGEAVKGEVVENKEEAAQKWEIVRGADTPLGKTYSIRNKETGEESAIAFSSKEQAQKQIDFLSKPKVSADSTLEAEAKQELVADEILMSGEAQKRRQEGRYEKDGITFERNPEKDGPKGSTGNVRFAQGEQEMPFTFRLIEADELQPSHINGRRNPLHFLPEAQPKTRDDAASIKAEDDIAANPRLDLVGEDTGAYSGAPIVNKRGEVVQGNNRAAGLKKTYQRNNPSYKQQLAERAGEFGLTKEQVEGMKNPVLVREVAFSDDAAIRFGNYKAADLETGGKSSIDPVTVSARMPLEAKQNMLGMLFTDGATTLKAAIRDNFKRAAQAIYPYINAAQKNSIERTTTPSQKQMAEMEGVVLQFLFDGGDPNLSQMFEGLSATQQGSILKAMPDLFSVPRDKSIVPEVQSAIGAATSFETSGVTDFDAWAVQSDMFNGNMSPSDVYTPTEMALAKILAESPNQSAFANAVRNYTEQVKGSSGDMFTPPTEGITKEEALKKQFNDDTGGKKAVGAATPTMAPKKEDAKADKPTRKPREPKPSKPKVAETEVDADIERLEKQAAERKALADRIRDKKIGGVSFADPLFGAIGISKTLYDGAIELAAKQVEKGTKIGTAIANAIKYIDERMAGKKWDKGLFGRHLNDQFKMMVNGKEVEVKRDLSEETLEVVNGWYSPLEKTIKDTKADSLTAKEWLDRVRSKEGEDMWTGLRGMLEAKNPKDRVSKRELLNYLKDNRVDVVEVVKGATEWQKTSGTTWERKIDREGPSGRAKKGKVIIRQVGPKFYGEPTTTKFTEVFETLEEAKQHYDKIEALGGDVKFSSYQLEGEKANYKEVLVVIPRTGVMQKVGDYTVPYAHAYGEDLADNRRLVHLRMNTRKDADGNKVLFLEEVQSDWGQKGKREGFDSEKNDYKAIANRFAKGLGFNESIGSESDVKLALKRIKYKHNRWEQEYAGFKEAGFSDAEINKMAADYTDGKTPSAPFVTDTNSWVKLGVKVALKEAVAQGADKIAWTTGEQQNERYSLDKSVSSIGYDKKKDGTYSVLVKGLDGKNILEKASMTISEIEQTLGKDIAQKIQDGKDSTDKPADQWEKAAWDESGVVSSGVITGEGLKVEGKGMKGFYGSPKEGSKGILGSVMEAVTGQEVEKVAIPEGKGILGKPTVEELTKAKELAAKAKDADAVKFLQEQIDRIKNGQEENYGLYNSNVSASKFFDEVRQPSVYTQPSISITPELRSAVEKGQPLFGTSNVELAKAIRDKKIKGGLMFADPTGGFVALSAAVYNKAVDIIADQVEKGTSLGKAVQSAIEYIDSVMGGKKWDRRAFKEDFMGVESQQTASEKAPKKERKPKTKSKKRYTARTVKALAELKGKEELEQAIRDTGLSQEIVPWKKVQPIATEIVEDVFSDPKDVDAKANDFYNEVLTTTNKDYIDNRELSTLHALTFHMMLDRMANEGLDNLYVKYSSLFQDIGSGKGRFISAMQQDASPYALMNLKIRPIYEGMNRALDTVTDTGSTRFEEIAKVKELVDELLAKDELLEAYRKKVSILADRLDKAQTNQTLGASFTEAPKQKLKGKARVNAGRKMFLEGLRDARGQLSAGLPINEKMLNGIKEMIAGLIEEGVYEASRIKKSLMKDVNEQLKGQPDAIIDLAAAIDTYLQSEEFEDSRKEAMKAAFVESLENRAKSLMGNKRATDKTAEQVLLDTLLQKMGQEIGKDAAKGSKAYEQRLKAALENLEFSDDIWKAAVSNVKTWLERQNMDPVQKAEILARLEDSASLFMDQPFAKSDLRKAIRDGEKEIGVAVQDVVKQHWTKQNRTLESLAEKLVSELGLNAETAKKYEQAVMEEAKEYMNEKRLAAIREALSLDKNGMRKERSEKVNKRVIDRMIEAINLGILDDNAFRGFFAEKYGIVNLTPKDIRMMKNLNDLINIHEGTDISRRYTKELAGYVETLKPWTATRVMMAAQGMTIKGMLTGLSTIAVNIPIGSIYSFTAATLPAIISNPVAFSAFMSEYSKAGLSKTGLKTFWDVLVDGYSPQEDGLGSKYDERDVYGDPIDYMIQNADKKKLWKDVRESKSPKEAAKNFGVMFAKGYLQIYRLANFAKAFDVLLSTRGVEFDLFLRYWNEESKAAGHPLRGKFDPNVSKDFIDKVREKMVYDPETRKEIEESVDKQIAGMRSRGERVGISYRQTLIREAMIAKRSMEDYKKAKERVASYLLMEQPTGLLSYAYDPLTKRMAIKEDNNPVSAALKLGFNLTLGLFLRISITAAQRGMENIPIAGLALPGILYDRVPSNPLDPRSEKEWRTFLNEKYDREQMKRRLMTHASVAALAGIVAMNMFSLEDDEEEEEQEDGSFKIVKRTRIVENPDKIFDVTGFSGEFFKTEQFNEMNTPRKDYYFRMKVGDKWHNAVPLRLAPHFLFPVSVLGGMSDDLKFNPNKDRRKRELLIESADDFMLAWSEMSFATIPKTTKTLYFASQKGGGEGLMKVGEIVVRPVRTAVYPNAYRDAYKETKFLIGAEEKLSQGVLAPLVNDFPFLEDYMGESTFDIFGYPKKVTSKLIQSAEDAPGAGMLVDSFLDYSAKNEERFESPAWQKKMKYFPNVEIPGYWPSGFDYETKVRAAQLYGELLRKQIEAIPESKLQASNVEETAKVIDIWMNGRIQYDGSRSGGGMHNKLTERVRATIGIDRLTAVQKEEFKLKTTVRSILDMPDNEQPQDINTLLDKLAKATKERKALEEELKPKKSNP